MRRCHLTFEALLDYHEGRVDAGKAERIQRHLKSGCPACQQHLEWFGAMLPALNRAMKSELPVVPVAAMERARDIARERQPERSTSVLVQMAQLIFDSRQSQPVFGARDVMSGETQMIYTTPKHDVDLWQERQSANIWYLIGQVLPRNGGEPVTPEQILLTARDGRLLTGETEATEFTIRDVPVGAYEIRLRLPDLEIVLPGVRIGPPEPQ